MTKRIHTPATQIPKLSKRIGGALSPSSAQSSSAEIQASSSNNKIKVSFAIFGRRGYNY